MKPELSERNPLCIIPARGGSKRIPRKNIKIFGGKPMIQWSIEAAQKAGCFDQIIVSTDCPEIADVAMSCGAAVPFMRPPELADDHTITATVIDHAVTALLSPLKPPEKLPVCCLYATAPFVQAEDILDSLHMLQACEFVMPVTQFAFPIQRASRIDDAGQLTMFNPEHYTTRSQDLEEAWHDIGQFYWGTANAWRSNKSPFEMGASAYRVPPWRVQDIDTPEDWQRAEHMFMALSQKAA